MRRSFLALFFLLLATGVASQDAKVDFTDGEFFLAEEEYEEALYTFTKVYNNGYQDNANINFRIGICLLQIPGRKTEAIPYLEKAVTSVSTKYKEGSLKEVNTPPDAHVYLGNAYRINMEFEKACEQYMLYDEFVGTKGDIQSIFAEQQILSCAYAVVAINEPVEYTIGNLGQVNQTHRDIYNMVVSHDLQTMAFMGKNPFYRGIYVSRKENELWTKPSGINASVASDGNMDVVGLSSDGNIMLLAVSDEFASNIYTATYENDRWNIATSIGKPINSRYFESHATFSPGGESIYFTSNRSESVGAMDIFRSDKQEDGSWGDPVNLEPLNTPLNEETPFLSPDGKRIYFSSQGHNSIGGFDIFYSEMQSNGNWGKPVNLGYPLNSTDDDFTLAPTYIQDDGVSYIFANAEPGQHSIFKFELIDVAASPVPVPFEEPIEEVTEVIEPEPVPETKTPDHYLVKPVFFAFDSNVLSTEAKSSLDELAGLLDRFPTLELEITGHTDAVGAYDYNQRLSIKRAKAVSGYLASTGISENRLSIAGKSESEHVARNRTKDNKDAPDGRKLNRRAEFKISVSDDVVVEMEKIQVPEHLIL